MRLYRITVGLKRPLRTSYGGSTERCGLILELRAPDAVSGYGEISPLPGYHSTGLDRAAQLLDGASAEIQAMLSAGDPSQLLTNLSCSWPAELRCGLEAALMDIEGRRRRRSVSQLLSASPRRHIQVNALLSSDSPDDLMSEAAQAVSLGFACLKVKVGASPVMADVGRVAAVRQAVGAQIAIRIDANGGWDLDRAERALGLMAPLGIELAEQPLAADRMVELAHLRRRSKIPLAADEGAYSAEAIERLVRLGAVDTIVLKTSRLGGIKPALEVAATHSEAVDWLVASALETSIGLAPAIHLAACLARLGGACGLATAALLQADLTSSPLLAHDGIISVPQGPGMGVEPDLLLTSAGRPADVRSKTS